MLILVVVLLVLWLILTVVGFAFKGLVWLAIIGIILFAATASNARNLWMSVGGRTLPTSPNQGIE